MRRGPSVAAIVALLSGCVHTVGPVDVPAVRIPEEGALRLPPTLTVWVENGAPEAAPRLVRKDGVHSLHIDEREWSERLAERVRLELERRGARTFRATASMRLDSALLRGHRWLRLQLTAIRAASADLSEPAEVTLEARAESVPEGFAAGVPLTRRYREFRRRLPSDHRGTPAGRELRRVARGMIESPRLA